jgi:hypothetical protein
MNFWYELGTLRFSPAVRYRQSTLWKVSKGAIVQTIERIPQETSL